MANFLRSYETEMAKYTDAPDVFHTATASNLLGAALTTYRYRCVLAGGVEERWTNLWTFIVGDSAESRKSTAINMGVAVLKRAMPLLRCPDDGSPEGFGKDFVEKSRNTDHGAAGLLVQSELGMFLMNMQKDYNKSMKGMLMEFYDVPPVYKKKLSREEFTVHLPRFSMLGGVALELLPNMTSAEDWLGGFMNRALIIFAARSRTQERPLTPPEGIYDDLSAELWVTLKEWRKTRMAAQKAMPKHSATKQWLFDFDDDGLKECAKVKKAGSKTSDPNVKLLRGRADVHLQKLAAIEQIAMDPTSRVITKKAVQAAAVLWMHWWENAPLVMETAFARSNADLEGDKLPRRLLRLVRDRGAAGFPEIELMHATVLSWDHFQKALNSLEQGHMVQRIDAGDGTPVRIVCIC